MRISPITYNNCSVQKNLKKIRNLSQANNNSVTFNGRFLPKGIKGSDLLFAAGLSMATPGLGFGYLLSKHIYAVASEDDEKDNK